MSGSTHMLLNHTVDILRRLNKWRELPDGDEMRIKNCQMAVVRNHKNVPDGIGYKTKKMVPEGIGRSQRGCQMTLVKTMKILPEGIGRSRKGLGRGELDVVTDGLKKWSLARKEQVAEQRHMLVGR